MHESDEPGHRSQVIPSDARVRTLRRFDDSGSASCAVAINAAAIADATPISADTAFGSRSVAWCCTGNQLLPQQHALANLLERKFACSSPERRPAMHYAGDPQSAR